MVIGRLLASAFSCASYAQHRGSNNPTVLPGAYGQALLAVWLVVAAATGLAVVAVSVRARRSGPPVATTDQSLPQHSLQELST